MKLRPKSFWTPRYVFDRLRLAYDQRRHPDRPWWPREARRVIDGLLQPTDRVLEWGSGRSTVWLSGRVKSVRSIEHDSEWFERVRVQLADLGTNKASIELRSADADGSPAESPYVRAIHEFDAGEFTVCVVDGEHRGHCAISATEKLASGGLLICDDASWFIDHPTRSPHARQGKGHLGEWAQLVEKTATWRRIWTTDGVTDTAIFLKP